MTEEFEENKIDSPVETEISSEQEKKPRKKWTRYIWRSLYITLAVLLFSIACFRIYLTRNFFCVEVDGTSMYPTLKHGEQLFVDYDKEAEIGDIIIVDVRPYQDPQNPKSACVKSAFGGGVKFLIKRLIAKEGDKVRCLSGTVEICYAGTDEWVEHPSEKYIVNKDRFQEYVVGENEIFFLGDNRTNSRDSRYLEPGNRGSHLNCLYVEEDIYGVVPSWAYEHRLVLKYLVFTFDKD